MDLTLLDYLVTFLNRYGIWCLIATVFLGIGFSCFAQQPKTVAKGTFASGRILAPGTFVTPLTLFAFLPLGVFFWISFLNPNYLARGYSDGGLTVFAQSGSVLWTADELWSTAYSQTGGSSQVQVRLQALDLNRGSLLFRKLVSSEVQLSGISGKRCWLGWPGGLAAVDFYSGSQQCYINEQVLKKKFRVLAHGVFAFGYDEAKDLVWATGLDGREFWIDPVGWHIFDREKGNAASAVSGTAPAQDGFNLTSLKGQGERQYLVADNAVVDTLHYYLGAKVVAVDKKAGELLIFSYQNLHRDEFLISGVGFDGKLHWMASQSMLKARDWFVPNPVFERAFSYGSNWIICMDGFVFSLEKAKGRLNWLTRL